MGFKRLARNSWRLDPGGSSGAGRLPHAESQLSVGSEEYHSFKKNGFLHHEMGVLRRIPTDASKGDLNIDDFGDSEKNPRESISGLSSQETLAAQELHNESLSRRTSNTDNLEKDTSIKGDIEKGSAAATLPRDPGKVRPEVFNSTFQEILFLLCILVSLSMAEFIISGFQILLPALIEPLNIPQASRTWPSSVLTLVVGSLLFPMGRLADMYGGYIIYTAGMAWFTLWAIISGLTQNFTMLIVCRAMTGLGAAAYLPAGITILGRIYRPGPRKNLVFAVYGALSPISFFAGLSTGGIANLFLSWRWFFWIGGIISGLSYVGVVAIAPRDYAESRAMKVKMDWLGAATLIPGIMLTVFAIQDSSRAPNGWGSPRIIICGAVGILFLCSAVYVEGWVAEAPLLPPDIFKVKYMKRMIPTLILVWGLASVYVFNVNFFVQDILHKTPLLTALWLAPLAIGAIAMSLVNGYCLHLVPGSILLAISGLATTVAFLLFALIPENPSYWLWVMPSLLADATSINMIWVVGNVFLTTSLPKNRQGLAGALINVSIFLGSAFAFALTDVAAGVYRGMGWDDKKTYQGIFFFGTGLSALGFFMCLFIPIGKAVSKPETAEEQALPQFGDKRPRSAESDQTLCPTPGLEDSIQAKKIKRHDLGRSSSTLTSVDEVAATKSRLST